MVLIAVCNHSDHLIVIDVQGPQMYDNNSDHFVVLVVQDVVDCHPGLSFLQDAPEFHSRYIHTVSSRRLPHLFPFFPWGKGTPVSPGTVS